MFCRALLRSGAVRQVVPETVVEALEYVHGHRQHSEDIGLLGDLESGLSSDSDSCGDGGGDNGGDGGGDGDSGGDGGSGAPAARIMSKL